MQAVILAAGMGTRMGELTRNTPKPLLKIQDLTLLEHNLRALPVEIDEVVLVVGYLGDKIKNAIGDYFPPHLSSPTSGEELKEGGKRIIYVHQDELKGTGHALSLCKDVLRERFLVLMGDDLYEKEDLSELVKKPLGILVLELESDDLESGRQALVKIDENGQLLDIIERQPAHKGMLVNVGAYVLDTRYFNYLLVPAGIPANEYGLPQTFLQMVRDGAKFEIVKARWWHKVTSPQDLSSRPPSRDPSTLGGPLSRE